jgi:hypothetical protein
MNDWLLLMSALYRNHQEVPMRPGQPRAEGGPLPVGPVPLELLRFQQLVDEELLRLRELFLRAYVAPQLTPGATTPSPGGASPVPDSPEATVEDLLRKAQLLLLRHPAAAQAAFSSLVAEGRRFAATPEGARWRDALAGSALVRRARLAWEKTTLGMLEESPAGLLPSTLIELLVAASPQPTTQGSQGPERSSRD